MITTMIILGISYVIYNMMKGCVNVIKKVALYAFVGLGIYVLGSMLIKFILRILGIIS